jgi:hypothetical protein
MEKERLQKSLSDSKLISSSQAEVSLKQITSRNTPSSEEGVQTLLTFASIAKAHPDAIRGLDVKHRTSTRNVWIEYAVFFGIEMSFIEFSLLFNENVAKLFSLLCFMDKVSVAKMIASLKTTAKKPAVKKTTGKKTAAKKSSFQEMIGSEDPSFELIREGLKDAVISKPDISGKLSEAFISSLGGESLTGKYKDDGSSKDLAGTSMIINAVLNVVLACSIGYLYWPLYDRSRSGFVRFFSDTRDAWSRHWRR